MDPRQPQAVSKSCLFLTKFSIQQSMNLHIQVSKRQIAHPDNLSQFTIIEVVLTSNFVYHDLSIEHVVLPGVSKLWFCSACWAAADVGTYSLCDLSLWVTFLRTATLSCARSTLHLLFTLLHELILTF